jgi:hypothetical protein
VPLGATLVHTPAARPPAAVAASLGLAPSFEPNVGQSDPAVRFVSHGPGGTLYLTRTEAIVALLASAGRGGPADVLRMRLLGSDPAAPATGGDRRPGTTNYLVGDRSRWHTGVPTYGRVTLRGVYRGIDLVYHGTSGRLEYDFDVAPGADPDRIALELSGARRLRIDARGRLHVQLRHRALVQDAPRVYQDRGGIRRAVRARYVLRGARVGFALGVYDRSSALVIDPAISYSTYLGGKGNDVGTSLAVDRSGNAYVAGSTTSANLPLRQPLRAVNRGRPIDAFVAKIDPAGRLVYATYLGGSAYTDGRGIAVDRGGHAFVTGATGSRDFPTRHALQPDYGGGPYDAYVAKLAPSGRRLLWSTFNGGPRNDRGYAIAVDAAGAPVAVGRTAHDGFPARGRLGHGPEGGAFVTKFAPSGQRIVYSTVLGGHSPRNSSNTPFGVAVDRRSNAYVTGITAARDFPTARAQQRRYGGGLSNAFVTKIDARGTRLVYSTYFGGSGADEGVGIAVDRGGSAYVTGNATSADFPAAGPRRADAPGAGNPNAFVAKLGASGALVYSQLLGGTGTDAGNAIAVDSEGRAYVTGSTASPDMHTKRAVQPGLAGASDAFVAALSPSGSSLVFSTYLGGSDADAGLALALGGSNAVYVTGQTASPDFPTRRPVQRAPRKRAATAGGGGAAFVTRLAR